MSSSPSVLLTAAVAAAVAAVPMCYLAGRAAMRARVGTRSRPMSDARKDQKAKAKANAKKADQAKEEEEESPHARRLERPTGVLERWYMGQPEGQKRGFVLMFRLGGVRPTLDQLRCALSRVALKHPVLLIVPDVAGSRYGMQIPEDAAGDGAMLNFPLDCLSECVEEVSVTEETGGLDGLYRRLIEGILTIPDPTPEECAAARHTPAKWRGLKIMLVKEPGASQEGQTAEEFSLVLRLAHIIGDGLSGIVLMKHLLTELASAGTVATPPPSAVPASELTSIADYPSMDDLMDTRPPFRRLAAYLLETFTNRFKSPERIAADHAFWDGRNLVADEADRANGDWTTSGHTELIRIHVAPDTQRRLHQAASANGCTLQAVMSMAACFAGALLSDTARTKLKAATPYSTRRMLRQASGCPKPDELIGNFIAAYMGHVELVKPEDSTATTTSGSRSDSGSGGKVAQSFWPLARHLLASFRRDHLGGLEDAGMLAFVDARQFVLETQQHQWKARSNTVLVSNLGGVDQGPQATMSAEWQTRTGFRLRDLHFCQPAHYTQALFVNNVVSTAAGGLNNYVCYATGILTREQAARYAEWFEYVLHRLAEGEDVDFQQLVRHVQQEEESRRQRGTKA